MTPSSNETLERIARRIPIPEPAYERMLRRRDRKRRNQRIAAGVTGIAVFVLAVWIVTSGSWFDRTQTPAVRPTPPPSVDSPGTFEDVHGWIAFRTGEDLLAVDPADPGEIISLGSFDELSLASPFDQCRAASEGSLDPRDPFGQVYLDPCGPVGWSRDGTRLLLSIGSLYTPRSGLSVLGDDGSRDALVGSTHWGAISPDGSQVVYSRGGFRGPYIVDADGGTPRSLAGRDEVRGELSPVEMSSLGGGSAEATAWSPDGSTIAWLDLIPGAGHNLSPPPGDGLLENFLSFVNPDGTGLRKGVATLPGIGGNSLVWSPDGSQLAFWMADDDDRNAQIFVINADGTGLRQVTHQGENQWPTWSPDGSRIAFVHDGALYTMAPDGSDMMEVEGVSPEGPIAWNPVP